MSDFRTIAKMLGFPDPIHVGNGIYACEADITPEIAQSILDNHHTVNNRNLAHSVVSKYVADMYHGRWRSTHQGIAFNTDGALFDGQHRLSSCIKAASPFPTLVFFNVPDASMPTVDTGRARNARDAMAIAGGRVLSSRNTSAVRKMGSGTSLVRWTSSEVLLLVDIFEDAVSFLADAFPTNIKSITVGPVEAAVGRAFYHMDPGELREFCWALRNGEFSSPRLSGAKVLWKWLLTSSPASNGASNEKYLKTSRAIHAFKEREALAKLYGSDSWEFPLTEPLHRRLAEIRSF